MKRNKFQDIFTNNTHSFTFKSLERTFPADDFIPHPPQLNAHSTERVNHCKLFGLIQNTFLFFSNPNANREMELWYCRSDGYYGPFFFASIPWWWNGDGMSKKQAYSPLTWLTLIHQVCWALSGCGHFFSLILTGGWLPVAVITFFVPLILFVCSGTFLAARYLTNFSLNLYHLTVFCPLVLWSLA